MGFITFSGNHDNGNALRSVHGLELLQEFNPIHYGHIDVAQNEIDSALIQSPQCFGAIGCFQHLGKIYSGLAQRTLHDFPHHR